LPQSFSCLILFSSKRNFYCLNGNKRGLFREVRTGPAEGVESLYNILAVKNLANGRAFNSKAKPPATPGRVEKAML